MLAVLWSTRLDIAFQRFARYKKLIGPMVIRLEQSRADTTVFVENLDIEHPVPVSLTLSELVYLLQFSRLATRRTVCPVSVVATADVADEQPYTDFFGRKVVKGESDSITFSNADMALPLVSANRSMWEIFEPILTKRLVDFDAETTIAGQVRRALSELLPSGLFSIGDVAREIGTSTRTLQRRLREESTTYQDELRKARSSLANHYLLNSDHSSEHIAFLLGFDDPGSFSRAFKLWSGKPPEAFRAG